ncbi:hypothetical protein [Sphingobacterium yanglingense]|uniref:Uncharacterized protein n=1 Tax=Sphingobacterium yanglingense TaxID=1437280 RepID=A0A4R6WM03_9SPHI|nr:hypothetical protein [Sphingobacterium yanglingense]TDQ79802.1 hypothetical protein CLV99_1252 [Sphingobacterium yanglingense]
MGLAYPIQKFQDWCTQQWVILWGRKIEPEPHSWLMGAFGDLNGIGEQFINELVEKENLVIERDSVSRGLIPSITAFALGPDDLSRLSRKVIAFYENTSDYNLRFGLQWSPLFKVFGKLVNMLFSSRINQLNIPTENIADKESLTSEIIALRNPNTNEVVYTIWLRKFKTSGKVIYSGLYGTCKLPSGETCLKATFPLPKGNATVIMSIGVGVDGELILNSSGRKFGDAGFYFLLQDRKGAYWSQYIRSFRDRLTVCERENSLTAEQVLTLWNQTVVRFNYTMRMK